MGAAAIDKLFFRIGEVAAQTALRASVLRYWESEFPDLKPKKSRSGQRLYTSTDLDLICNIKRLLYTEKLTIEGARKRIALEVTSTKNSPAQKGFTEIIREVIEDLKTLRNSL